MPEAQGDSNLTKLPEVVMPDPKQKLEKLRMIIIFLAIRASQLVLMLN